MQRVCGGMSSAVEYRPYNIGGGRDRVVASRCVRAIGFFAWRGGSRGVWLGRPALAHYDLCGAEREAAEQIELTKAATRIQASAHATALLSPYACLGTRICNFFIQLQQM